MLKRSWCCFKVLPPNQALVKEGKCENIHWTYEEMSKADACRFKAYLECNGKK